MELPTTAVAVGLLAKIYRVRHMLKFWQWWKFGQSEHQEYGWLRDQLRIIRHRFDELEHSDSARRVDVPSMCPADGAGILSINQGCPVPNEEISRGDGGARTRGATESEDATARDSNCRGGRILNMPKARIGPNENVRLRYSVPESGLVEFELEADHPVVTYIVRPRGLELFDEGSRTFKYYGGFQDPRRKHAQEIRLPFEGAFYLLILNPDQRNSVNVDYEVRY